jgi:predicted RNA-binding Zn-ribbon protein involved in translation (DUF1610 family)
MSDFNELTACVDCDKPVNSGDRVAVLTEPNAKHGYVYVCEECVFDQPTTFGRDALSKVP